MVKDGDDEWEEHDDQLKLSDEDNDDDQQPLTGASSDGARLFVPSSALKTQGSVVDMLMDGPSPQNPVAIAVAKGDWVEHDDQLKLSDDEEEEEEDASNALFIPQYELKTQGSVVDMLMDGPFGGQKKKQQQFAEGIAITPAEAVYVGVADRKQLDLP